MNPGLGTVPFYFPPNQGRYEVAPGLSRFGRTFGAGRADELVFQIDERFPAYRSAKLTARAARVGRCVCSHDLGDESRSTVAGFIARRLVAEHPSHFALVETGDKTSLRCGLTGEVLDFDASMRLRSSITTEPVTPPYLDAVDALACQVQEDLAVVSVKTDRHWLSAAHVCFPNGWAPEEKIGRSFAGLHEPVAGMTEMNRRGDEFARIMVSATHGLVRFAWGVTFDDRLDHHPDVPRTPFDPSAPRALLRVERQTIWGFPEHGAALFTIRTYLYDFATLRRDPTVSANLSTALHSMSPDSLAYKGLATARDDLVQWLSNP